MENLFNIVKEKLEKIMLRLGFFAKKFVGLVKEYKLASIPVALVGLMAFLNLGLISYLEKPWGIFSSTDFALAGFSNSYFSGGFGGVSDNIEISNYSET